MSRASRSSPKTARERAVGWGYRYLFKPYYVRSPSLLLRRLAEDPTVSNTRLPWKLPISFRPGSIIGTQLVRTGVHDLVLTEALYRLTDPGDVCIDVGANIGYTTSLLASRAGASGRVTSYEPAPDMFSLLMKNIGSWRGADIAEVEARQMAVSSVESQLLLSTPASHGGDSGGRTLEQVEERLDTIAVRSSTLDACGLIEIDVLKIDVEGHELSVLEGCDRLLGEQRIRDIVFEEHERPPTSVTLRLARAGYTVYRIELSVGGPRLVNDIERSFAVYWDAPNYLATTDPDRAQARFRGRGWGCLRSQRD